VGKNPVDIGGGHILDAKNKRVDEYMFRFLNQEEWNFFQRDSQIYYNGQLIGSPFEAHIWQFPLEVQVEYLKSIAVAGCNTGQEKPEKFVDWIVWKLGDKIAEDYMLPYNRKMFSENLNELGTYWLEKLPNVSFEETLMSCLEHKFYGEQPCHTNFYYPKKEGFGDVFLRMQRRLGDRFYSGVSVDSIDFETNTVNNNFSGEFIINTIPWTEFKNINGMPEKLVEGIRKLKYSSVQIDYYNEPLPYETTAQWIYYPSEQVSFHRIMAMENFALGSQGYWTETNAERIHLNTKHSNFSYMNKYAYPMNTLMKNEIMNDILAWTKTKKVYGLGRWGEWQHYNADVVMERAMNLIEIITS
jgi:protoporphyrinogen oxidase